MGTSRGTRKAQRSGFSLGLFAALAIVAAFVGYLSFQQFTSAATTLIVPTSDRSNDSTGWEITDGANTDCGSSGTLCSSRIDEDVVSGSPDSNSIRTESSNPTNDEATFEVTDFPGATEQIAGIRVSYRAREASSSSSPFVRVEVVDGSTVLGSPPNQSLSTSLTTYTYDITGLNLTETAGNGLFVRIIGNGSQRVTVSAINLTPVYTTTLNPTLAQSCGLDMALVIDSSGSVDSTELGQMKTALNGFVSAFLPETPTEIAVVEFDTTAAVTQGFTNNEISLNTAINSATSGGWTNWDDALFDTRNLFPHRADKPNLVVFATDGNPTARYGHSPNPTAETNIAEYLAMVEAVAEADLIRGAGTRILTLGIGNDLDTNNLLALSGAGAVYTSGFGDLAAELADLAAELCGGTITATKVIDLDGNPATTGDQSDGVGWTFSTNVDSPDSSTPASGPTDSNGQINFDIDLGGDGMATVDITETLQPNHVFISASCEENNNPVGTPSGTAVNNITLSSQDIVSCMFYNRPQTTFTVNKDFVPNNAASVTVALSCASGTDTPATTSVSESSPGVFTVSGFVGNPVCTATESPIPNGYVSSGTCAATITAGSCTILNTLGAAQLEVSKDFSDNNAATVTIAVTCTSGVVANDDTSASEADPANFTITGFNSGATCTATESGVPAGYTTNNSACVSVGISDGNVSNCTIVNTLNTANFTVNKDFQPNIGSSVTVSLSCASGTAAPSSASASEALPAVFTVTGFVGNPSCTATESPIPTGYSSSGTCSAALAAGSCTIVNTLNSASFTVNKDFVPNNAASVTVSLVCATGSASPASASASESTPAAFTVTGFTGNPSCTATESPIPAGYTSSGTCSAPLMTGSCTIVNTLNTASFTVNKDFSDNSAASVTVSLACASGTDTPATASVSESSPGVFTVTGFVGNPSCTATESPIPAGYSSSGTCTAPLLTGSCTIVNTLNTASFTVNKDFQPNAGGSVTVSLSCASGSDTPATAPASESSGAVFTVTGYAGDPLCTATESPVPAGYSSSGTCAALLSAGSCTIVNTLNTANFTVQKDFVPNSAASVTVSLSCITGTATPASASASESTPAAFTVTGSTGDPLCTATESPIPTGYSSSGTCVAALSAGTCTVVNTLNSANFTVNKDFSDNNPASVTVSLSCASGSDTPATASASESGGALFTVTGYTGDPLCTATESPIPAGYSSSATCAAPLSAGSCTITNTLRSAQVVVNKDFSDNSTADVTIAVTCTSGSVANDDTTASESDPANFTITGFNVGATCTPTEGVPAGYTANQAGCSSLLISDGGTASCTIINTLNTATFNVNKDFSDNSAASVTVSLSCASGSDSPATASASESTPASFAVTGFVGDPVCTATESPVPAGYTSSGTCNAALFAGSCTIVNTLNSATFTVHKDFSDNNPASVTVSLSCASGSDTPASASASESGGAVFTVTGFVGDPTCTATESPIPAGYGSTASCSAALSAGSCTILNVLNAANFTVEKDFVPDNAASVTVSLSCASGSDSPATASASESTPAVFMVTAYTGDPVCTATEAPIPGGYSSTGSCSAPLSVGTCTIVNTLNQNTFIVNKDFSDNSAASVTVSLSCASGTAAPASASATESSPAMFSVSGYSGDPLCTATEAPVPTGYTSTGTCAANLSAGSCTIVNTLNSANFTVQKDFVPNSAASVTVSLSCASGTAAPASASASESAPAAFTVSGFTGDPNCTATEAPVPSGYTSSGTCSALLSAGTCTIVNTLNTAGFTVQKDFVPDSAASVTVTLSCGPAGVAPASASSSESTPASFTVTGFSGDPTCTATESPIPAGYASTGTCSAPLSAGTCTIVNTLRSAQVVVNKDFTDNNAANVTVTLTCSSGSVANDDTSASESDPANFTVTGFNAGATCTATEGVPAGYTANQAGCANLPISDGGTASCTIVNTPTTDNFTVQKDFVPNNAASVTVSLSCASGTASPASASASESTPASFTVTGFVGDPTCTATESPIPAGYTSSGTCAALLSVGTCTIVNNITSDTFQVNKDFVPNSAASVTVSLSCASGTALPASASASESTPAMFTVTGFIGDPNCTATESPVPAGYTSTASCQALLSAGVCTIVNNLNTDTFVVSKDFVPNNAASVTVSLACASGTASPASAPASEATPASFTVTGFTGNPNCTATESPIPAGYSSTGNCSASLATGACTIVNTSTQTTFTVVKDFVPDTTGSITVSLVCFGASVAPASQQVSEASPAVFIINNFTGDPTCTATEPIIPGGYTSTGNCSAPLSAGTCTIVNTLSGPMPTAAPAVGGIVDLPVAEEAGVGSAGSGSTSSSAWILILLAPLALVFVAGATWFARKQ